MSTLNLKRVGEHVLEAEINRPDARNAVNFDVMSGLEKALDQADKDESVRLFVLKGAGRKYFASGGDLKEFADLKTETEAEEMSRRMGVILDRIEHACYWTVACINGDAYGGGCELMLAFDFRVAAKHVRFGFTQAKFYLPPGWGGLTRLVERVGRSTALYWLGSQTLVDADSALLNGLIDAVEVSDSMDDQMQKMSGHLVQNDRKLIRALKRGAFDAIRMPRAESIENERKMFAELWADPEHFKRVDAFLNRKRG